MHTHVPHKHTPLGYSLILFPTEAWLFMSSHSLISTAETQLCVGGRVPLWCPLVPLRLQTGTKRAGQRLLWLLRKKPSLPRALGASCKYSTPPPLLPQPEEGRGVVGKGFFSGLQGKEGPGTSHRGAGGDVGITKGLAPTTGSGSFLPRAVGLARGGEGPSEGGADSASLCPRVGVADRHAGQGQVVWAEDGRPLCFGKRQNPDQ